MPPALNDTLKTRTIIAHNFAQTSDNKIHSDDVAAQFGFRGGLVPGVGVYAYMTIPVVEALGREWLEHGAMRGKFLKPVYHGESVEARATVVSREPLRIETSVVNREGTICAVGEATMPSDPLRIDPAKYPRCAMPPTDARRAPESSAIPPGTILGSLEFEFDLEHLESPHSGPFVDAVVDPLPLYRGPGAVCHPAFITALGNAILASNVALGPWIHTASEVRHIALPRTGEKASLRGCVRESYERRGHECVVIDLALFGENDRPLYHIVHSAIVRPARTDGNG